MSENYIVSARKYRPTTFETVVGQSTVTDTLKNAIKINKLAQAYLFCGPRGVGKTTCARILAKTLNCLNRTENLEACDECESCKAFKEQRSYNIHELDAASNNSVDDIRRLCDQVRIPPQIGKYSVYIIDEVHMLSAQAFNAFLKTLEEPPSYAIFILATTEKHKIIPTILSRCQIFDFNRIKIEDIANYLQQIAQKEGVEYEPEALSIIAQKADGGMRDALSIFDQMVSFSGGHITYKDVIANLNVLDYEYFFRIADACLHSDYAQCLLNFKEILDAGFDGHLFINGLADHLRNLLVAKDTCTLSLLEVGEKVKLRYQQQASQCTTAFLFEALNICNQCDVSYRLSKNQRLLVEIALIRLSGLLRATGSPVKGNTPPPVVNRPTAPSSGSVATSPVASSAPQTTPSAQASPFTQQPVPPAQAPSSPAASVTKPEPSVNANPVVAEPTPKPVTSVPHSAVHTAPPPSLTRASMPSLSIKAALSETAKPVSEPQPTSLKKEVDSTDTDFEFIALEDKVYTPLSEAQLQKEWPQIIAAFKEEEPRLYAALAQHIPTLVDNETLQISASHQQVLDEMEKIKRDLLKSLQQTFGISTLKLQLTVAEQASASQKYFSPSEKVRHLTEKYPLLQSLQEQFSLDLDL